MPVEDPAPDQPRPPVAKGAASDDEDATSAVAEQPATAGAEPQPRPEPVAGKREGRAGGANGDSKLPIKMLNDRILVEIEGADGERRSSGGILIPATAQVGKRLAWAQVVAVGPSVRSMELEDRVLFNPEDRYEVEVGGRDYIILRERDIHAVAARRLDDSHTGLYL